MSRTLNIGDPIISSDDFRIGMVISSGVVGGRTYKIVKRYPRATEYGSVWGWVELRKNGTWPKGPKRINGHWLSQHFPRHGYDVVADPTLTVPGILARESMLTLAPKEDRGLRTGYGELRSPVYRANKRTEGHDRARKKIGGRTRPGGKPWLAGTMAERIAIRAGVDFDLLSDGRGGFGSLSRRDFEKIVDALGGE